MEVCVGLSDSDDHMYLFVYFLMFTFGNNKTINILVVVND